MAVDGPNVPSLHIRLYSKRVLYGKETVLNMNSEQSLLFVLNGSSFMLYDRLLIKKECFLISGETFFSLL